MPSHIHPSIRVVTGHAVGPDTHRVVEECLRVAQSAQASSTKTAWALAFCGGRHDADLFIAGMRDTLGDIPIIGGAAVGTIGHQLVGFSGYEATIALFPSSLALHSLICDSFEDDEEFMVGQRIGEQLLAVPDEAVVVLFYDSVRTATPVHLHVGSRLLDGIYERLGNKRLHLVGGGTLTNFNFRPGYVFDGYGTLPHGVVAAVLPPCLHAVTRIFHGCVPASSFMTITAIDGAVVQELDGRPALEALTEILGEDFFSGAGAQLTLSATLGAKQGNLFAPYDETNYVNRLILSYDAIAGSITLFEPDFHVGAKIQVMSRSNDLMLDSVREGVALLRQEIHDTEPLVCLYVDCAGRSSMVSGAESEESALLAASLAPLPVIGFYSGVEFAPVLGRSRPLDWTGVATVLCYREIP